MTPDPLAPVPTEAFSVWLRGFREAQERRDGEGASVPCGECRGCCTSAYFIPIAPDETDTLSHIPKALLFPAPGLPKGHRLLGYRENGHCPLFVDNACSIYRHRPRACRRYDCRLFPAAGIAVEEGKPGIAARAARWRFAYPAERDRREHAAVLAAARFLERHAGSFPPGTLPDDPAQRALMALRVFELFLGTGDIGPLSGSAAGPAMEDAVETTEEGTAIRVLASAVLDTLQRSDPAVPNRPDSHPAKSSTVPPPTN